MTDRPRYALEFTPGALRQLRRLDRGVQERVKRVTEQLRDDPRPAGVSALVGAPGRLRVRVGDWRVIYRVEDSRLVVLVVEVGHRREVYRNT